MKSKTSLFKAIKAKFGRDLRNEGFKFNPRYEPNAVEVTVSYFKGWHWDE